MKNMKTNIKYFFLILFFSCNSSNKTKSDIITKLILSNDVNKIVEGYFIIGEEKQIKFIKDIIINPVDNRISHHYKFNGISVYQSKMIALKKISGLEPPIKISSKSNIVVIEFYYKWALKEKYINVVHPKYVM